MPDPAPELNDARPLPAPWVDLSVDPTLHPGHTVRPHELSGDTLAAVAGPVRALPSLSVDLREARPGTDVGAAFGDGPDLEVRGVIGEGGMGRVLLARQHSMARDVAVKTARHDAPQSARDAILVEGTITGQLEHPAIVPVHALGLDPSGWPAMVMKRVEGVGWDGLLADAAHPGWEGWEGAPADRLPGHLQILALVCNAIHFAHSRGVVHRDVKPANVLIGRFGDVYLADWGVAARVDGARSQLCGTPAYMAPEMVTGEPVDARTDVYLLGATLHVVLTGKPRHPGSTLTESLLHARSSPHFPFGPEVPEELAALANRACHVDPAQRPATAQAFRDELTRYLRHRDARALGAQALKRVAELESLHALPAPDDEQHRRIERLLLEAKFGLDQALVQWADNAPVRAALGRVEAILEQRRARSVALERDANERDPAVGAAWRTRGLFLTTLLTLGVTLLASFFPEAPGAGQMVAFPAGVLGAIGLGGYLLRHRLMQTRFNRQVFGCMVLSTGFMVLGRAVGLFVTIAPPVHFARDCFVVAAVMAVCAVTLLRWTALISALFIVAGVLCSVFPAASLQLFMATTVIAMAISTLTAWWVQRSLVMEEGPGAALTPP